MQAVAITGIGIESSIGSETTSFWSSIAEGQSGIRPLAAEHAAAAQCAVAGTVDFSGAGGLSVTEKRRIPRFQQMHLSVVQKALEDAGVAEHQDHALVSGTSLGGLAEIPRLYTADRRVWRSSDRLAPLKILSHTPASVTAEVLGIRGRCVTVGTACAASTDAILLASEMIRTGRIERAIAAGVECWVAEITMSSFARMGALTRRPAQEAASASRPFDASRDGLVPGEGAGALHLESLASATQRGARVYAVILGGASNCDAFHPTRPRPDAAMSSKAITDAITDAGVSVDEIDHVNTHGTSTSDNDMVELLAINKALKNQADRVTVSATKSVIGHTLGAGGVLETAATALSIRHGFAPPIANLDNVDAQSAISLDTKHGIIQKINIAAKLSFGFGGHNTVLILGTESAEHK